MASATRLLKRWEQLYSAQANCRNTWQDIADFLIPHKGNIIVQRLEGERQTDKLFDATGPHALMLLSSSLHGSMTPATQPWLSLKMRQDELNEDKEIEDWLEDSARRMHKAYRQSTFNQSVHELYLDLTAFGIGCMLVEERPPLANGAFAGFRFHVPAVGTYAIAEDFDGQVDTVFRKFSLSARAAIGRWGTKVGKEVMELAETKPDETLEILHACYPRTDRAYGEDNQPKRGARNMPWASCYILMKYRRLVEEGGYEEFPYCVPRWAKTSGEVYGRGPSHTALPDVASLNSFKEYFLKVAPRSLDPPSLERDDAIVGELDTNPGGRNYVNGEGAIGDMIGFLEPRTQPDMRNITLMELRQSIHAIYFTDQLILHEKPNMTATEVLELREQMQRLLGPTTGRLESEFLNILVQRSFALMARARAFKPLPQALAQQVGQGVADLDIEYEGPMARAQRTIELSAQDRVMMFVAAITDAKAKAPGQEWDLLNTDKMIRDRADITGMPSNNLNGQEFIDALRKQRAEMQKQDAQREQVQQMTEMAKNAAPFLQTLQKGADTGNGTQS